MLFFIIENLFLKSFAPLGFLEKFPARFAPVRHANIAKRFARGKRVRAYFFHALGDINGGKLRATAESRFAYLAKLIRQSRAAQIAIIRKRFLFYLFYRYGNYDLAEMTARKGVLAYFAKPLGQAYLRKAASAVKSILAYFFKAFRQND